MDPRPAAPRLLAAALLHLAPVLAVACSGSGTEGAAPSPVVSVSPASTPSPEAAPSTWIHHEEPAYGFALSVPAFPPWTLVGADDIRDDETAAGSPNRLFRAYRLEPPEVQVEVWARPTGGLGIDSWESIWTAPYVSRRRVTLPAGDALEVRYWGGEPVEYVQRMYLLVKRGHTVCLTFTTEPLDEELFAATFDRIIRSLMFFEPEEPPGMAVSFGDGVHRVNVDVAPGLYWNAGYTGSCQWARLRSLSGDDSVVQDYQGGRWETSVRILESDVGFRSEGCGTWRRALAP